MLRTIHDVQIAYDAAGSGEALLLIHAGIADRRMWRHQAAHFGDRYRVIALDLPGFGESDHENPASPPPHEIVVGLMDALRVERAVVVGDSMGGEVALKLALEHPERVAKLILVSTRAGVEEASDELRKLWADADDAFTRGDIARVVEVEAEAWIDGRGRGPADVDPEYRALAVEMIQLTWRRAGEVTESDEPEGERETEPSLSSRLAEMRTPTFLVRGDRDLAEIERSMDVLAGGIRGAHSQVISNTAHLPPLERPEEFNRLLEEFLDL